MIQVLQLGTVEYEEAQALQKRLVELRKAGAIGDTLILLEHPPVITLGRNAQTKNIVASQELLSERGISLVECDRGGDVTYHGPGQLVGYPIFDLRDFHDEAGKRKTLGPVDFVRRMEEALVRTCGDLGISCARIAGLTGVWTETQPQRKIAAIGVHISRGVTSHGFALNVANDLEPFQLIIPCGISDREVTSMQRELQEHGSRDAAAVEMNQVRHAVARNFGRVFVRQTLWLDSLDSLLKPAPANQDTPARMPEELRKLRNDNEALPA